MLDSYKTIEKESISVHKQLGSKFIAHLFPITSEGDFKNKLIHLTKKYIDAKHFCYAYKTLPNGSNFRYNDGGEPTNSAGKPILAQLDSVDITYCACVVVRYFGGVKLGVGGLIKAFKEVSKQAIQDNYIIQKERTMQVTINFNYAQINLVMGMIKKLKLNVLHQELNEKCMIRLECPFKTEIAMKNILTREDITFQITEN